MNKLLLGFVGIATLASTSFANLIPIGAIPSSGNGLGAVNSVVTFQNTGTESGCVGFIGGATVVGASACNTAVTGALGGNEKTGAGNNVYTASSLGITYNGTGGTRTFANLVLIFNADEPQGNGQASITLTNLSLNLFGSSSAAYFKAPSPQTYTALPGLGNAGYAYQLDATQAAAANSFLQANPDLRIGASATATGASGGPETIQVSTIASVQGPGSIGGGAGAGGPAVPEPSTYLLLAGGLISFGLFRKSSVRNS